jgi:DNA-binding transcriptional LysR family regulator
VNPDGVAVAARALALLCLYQSAGAVFFLALFERELPRVRVRVRRLGSIAALCGMALVPLLAPLMAARMAGDFSGLFNGALLRVAWHSSNATAQAVCLADGRLRLVLEAYQRPPTPLSILALRPRLLLPKVRAFVDFLQHQWMRPRPPL